ncbi:unnamed protein product [Pleuronectes platessa]|uniref:Fibronectin type-III domain-containing protein n=1 Tax=Pleuronectes platessa TaxID=8262 RepID=A0A9N7TVG5_PLEPL|nr:unnamed protein product [Pleuronectes platessa]
MIEAELPCGQLFTFTVKSQDDRCDSAASLPEEFKTGPCVPQHVQSLAHCEDSLGSVSWAPSDGAESYLAIATAEDNHTHMCVTNTSSCTWDDLHCGEMYTVHVIANDFMCSSLPSNSTSIRMAPCIPQNLESSLNCSIRVGSLTWNASETAEFYIVTAKNDNGHKLQLSTNDTWTFFSEFLCGQEYFLSVEAVDSECRSQPSPPSVLKSEPCPPTGVSSLMNCVSNIAVVSWVGSAGAEFYTATVRPEDDQSIDCWSDNTQCGMPNLVCGQNYTVTVVASNQDCHSDPSEADILQSVPCIPADVHVAMDCSKNEAVVSWSASQGALSYTVAAHSKQGHLSTCETAGLTCTLTNLTCGHTYLVQVSAQDDICSSLPSPVTELKSAPCTPSIGSVVLDCFTNSALLDWAFAQGAVEYTATARSSSGQNSTCNTNFTNCELQNLQCGQTYDVIVVASNENCSSPPSSRLQVESVPCPPEGVVAILNCSTNTAQVDWQPSMGADSYIVQAFSLQGDESGCETPTQSCILPDLLCGYTYNITVIADNSVCNVSSGITQLKAVPCVPQQVEAAVACESGGVAVSWEPSKGASSYTTVAQGSGGYESTCNSSVTTCLFSNLLCGLNYSISVSASDETCSSATSSDVQINTLPCVPQGVTVKMICSNDTGVVSWEEEEGVSSYRVQAFGPDGHRTECNSTGTSCELPGLHCGQLYNLTLTAQDGECDNSVAHLHLQSVPCTPTNVKASLLCHSNSAAVTWERASGAVSYLAVAVTADGSHRTECNNTMTHCDLDDLQCGQTYNHPCAPQNVTVNEQCAEGAMTVSWFPNPDAQYFHVAAVSNTGARLYCNSSSTTCTINNLPCGQHYNVTVLSVRDDCESQPSAVVETSSAPCMPGNPKSHLDCISNSAWVSWDEADGALSYFVYAEEMNGHNSTCTSTSSPCEVPDLKCGTRYTLHLQAENEHCHSNHSATFELVTGPCSLASISVATECINDTILVGWENTLNSTLYVVTAEGHDQSLISCNSSSDSCELEDVRCGMHYSIIVSASSNRCSSLRSPPKKIQTAPCAPDNVTVVQSCEESGVTVTWGHSPVATSYQLTATGSDGDVVNCSSSVNNCTLADLHLPCQPSGLTVDIDCETSSAVLSWDASEGAVDYYGCARPQDGDALYCNSTALSCTFDGLKCGEIYNFSVEASDGFCNSSFSSPLTEGAVPCPPTGLNVRMQKIDQYHWARTTWDSVNCSDVEYLAEISGRIRDDPQALMGVSSYWLPRRYFEFPMPCSTAYNLTVRARNSAGASTPSAAYAGVTVPCPPQNVKYSGNAQSAVLSWDASLFASTYTVYNTSGGGRVELCSTATLSCSLTDFNSSATEVTASNAEGESNPNGAITGPVGSRRRRHVRETHNNDLESPKVLKVSVSGLSVYVKWTTVKSATSYKLKIQDQSEMSVEVRTVEGDFYQETDLKPGTTYCIQVAAKKYSTQTPYSARHCRTTGASE